MEKGQCQKAVVKSHGFAFGMFWVQISTPPLTGYVALVASSVKWGNSHLPQKCPGEYMMSMWRGLGTKLGIL